MKFENYMIVEFPSRSTNEAFARSAVACFAAQMDPTMEELGDIRTAVSEAVTNSIVHGYRENGGVVYIEVRVYEDRRATILIRDKGCGNLHCVLSVGFRFGSAAQLPGDDPFHREPV